MAAKLLQEAKERIEKGGEFISCPICNGCHPVGMHCLGGLMMDNDRPLSPVHYSEPHGVHADFGVPPAKDHIPFIGQTTLPTFRIGGHPGPENDATLGLLGGHLHFP